MVNPILTQKNFSRGIPNNESRCPENVLKCLSAFKHLKFLPTPVYIILALEIHSKQNRDFVMATWHQIKTERHVLLFTLDFPGWVKSLNASLMFLVCSRHLSVFESCAPGESCGHRLCVECEVWWPREELEIVHALTVARSLMGPSNFPTFISMQVAHGLLGALFSYLWRWNPDPRCALSAPRGAPNPCRGMQGWEAPCLTSMQSIRLPS